MSRKEFANIRHRDKCKYVHAQTQRFIRCTVKNVDVLVGAQNANSC